MVNTKTNKPPRERSVQEHNKKFQISVFHGVLKISHKETCFLGNGQSEEYPKCLNNVHSYHSVVCQTLLHICWISLYLWPGLFQHKGGSNGTVQYYCSHYENMASTTSTLIIPKQLPTTTLIPGTPLIRKREEITTHQQLKSNAIYCSCLYTVQLLKHR